MDSLATFSLVSVLIIFISPVSTDQRNITAEAGQDIILPCRAPDSKPVIAVKWTRTDLGPDYVFLYRDEQISLENQLLSYKNRVNLKEGQMKDGDVSLVLKNVTTDDRGTYECRVVQTEIKSRTTIIIINLDVRLPGDPDGGNKDGAVGLGVGLSVGIIIAVVAAAGWLIYKKTSCFKPNQPPEEPAGPHRTLMSHNGAADP
ncbi:hyaluronan and proteoglycan link protein 4-like [Girardinichthys multiradiatus]|uniref:hyaluronan and proteoglycan link protein 4-like n=1 Tax=Girardinichthys multiradiatus TaxID=208333 RepID=UPI001FAB36D5|nr:hyaluronan and proteoglycan link protein 4-like [Girardinichthys multiradiatus]